MNNSRAEFIGRVLGVIGFFAIIYLLGSAFANDEPACIKPGCDNYQAADSSYCYQHKPSDVHSSYGTSPDSTSDAGSTRSYSSGSDYNSGSSYRESSDSNTPKVNHSNSYHSEMYDYDNADDYAEDYAEDYAIDEYGDEDSEEAYDYGYDEAYDDWEDEMDD